MTLTEIVLMCLLLTVAVAYICGMAHNRQLLAANKELTSERDSAQQAVVGLHEAQAKAVVVLQDLTRMNQFWRECAFRLRDNMEGSVTDLVYGGDPAKVRIRLQNAIDTFTALCENEGHDHGEEQ